MGIELRWLKDDSRPPSFEMRLQYRTMGQVVGLDYAIRMEWSEWQDVPMVTTAELARGRGENG